MKSNKSKTQSFYCIFKIYQDKYGIKNLNYDDAHDGSYSVSDI